MNYIYDDYDDRIMMHYKKMLFKLYNYNMMIFIMMLYFNLNV